MDDDAPVDDEAFARVLQEQMDFEYAQRLAGLVPPANADPGSEHRPRKDPAGPATAGLQGKALDLTEEEIIGFAEGIPADDDVFVKDELLPMLKRCLSSRVAADARHAVYLIVREVVSIVVSHLMRPGRLPAHILLILRWLFLDDAGVNFFFIHYGGTVPNDPIALEWDGDFGRLPYGGASKFVIGIMNRFGCLGGFDALARRLQQKDDDSDTLSRCVYHFRFCYAKPFATGIGLKLLAAMDPALSASLKTILVYNYGDDIFKPVERFVCLRVLCAAWSRRGVVEPKEDERLGALVSTVKARRVCRTRDGTTKLVEPWGGHIVAFLW